MKNLERCKNHTQQRDVFPTAGQKQKEDPRCIATPGVSSLWVSAGQGSDTRRLSGRWLTFCYWSSREIVTLLSSTRVRCHIRRRFKRNDRSAVRDFHRRRLAYLSRPEGLALQSAQFLKSRNPNGVVRLKNLQTGGSDRHRIQLTQPDSSCYHDSTTDQHPKLAPARPLSVRYCHPVILGVLC